MRKCLPVVVRPVAPKHLRRKFDGVSYAARAVVLGIQRSGTESVARGSGQRNHGGVKQYRSVDDPLDGADVVLVGLFSAKDKQFADRLDELAALVEARGSRVVGRFVQCRGASDRWKGRPGGASRMLLPFSRRTLLTHGKIREVAVACRAAGIDAVIFVNTLTAVQRTVLADLLGCLVVSGDDLARRAHP